MAAVLNQQRDNDLPGSWLDRLGIGVSAFCLLQCLALPLVMVLAPTMSAGFLSHEAFHLVLLAIIVPISGLAFTLGFLKHRNLGMWIPAGAGLAFLFLAAWLEQRHALSPLAIAGVTSAGGVCLIVGHWLNLRCRTEGLH